MTITVSLRHRTTYQYDKLVGLGAHIVRLRPAPHTRTPIKSYDLQITPADHFMNWQQDAFANWQARLAFPEKAKELSVTVTLVAEMVAINPFDFFLDETATEVPFDYGRDLTVDLAPYLAQVDQANDSAEHRAAFEQVMKDAPQPEGVTIDWLVSLNSYLQQAIAYTVRMEPGVQTPGETITKALGSCRDSAWLMVAMLRRFGFAARFVSGYLIQLAADLKAVDGPSGPEEDFTDLHAWCEVYLPGAGWVGLDPTSGLFAGEGHIPLACTPSPSSAAPISGAHEPADVSFDFEMSVTRIAEPPRITRPLTPTQWSEIDRAGNVVDAKLAKNDVRLTMGGEPTFVAEMNRDAEEWTVGAVGPTKRDYADRLIRRLRDRFAPGGVLHHGQGKWYPGEPLPRWSFSLIWRGDGTPIWSDVNLISEEKQANADHASAARFMAALTNSLDVDSDAAMPAYEDPLEFMEMEHKLPADLSPADNRLENPVDRQRLARVFDRGFKNPVAYVLPLQLAQAEDKRKKRRFRWHATRWTMRRGQIFLIPGDSPAGFRLPLNSLNAYPAADFPMYRDPMTQPRDLDPETEADVDKQSIDTIRQMRLRSQQDWVGSGSLISSPGNFSRTALSVEPRDGKLTVFLPPTASGEAYIDLIEAIEEAAAASGETVRIEGYEPPHDPRLNVIKVTPDPGVIEVNIHPAHNWGQLCQITEALYEEARQCGLDSTTFQIDGRPVGSGGGNHIVVGGSTPEDSPFLRRPDVLGSIVRYWQNHPSLSYLFSGLFIGPTSQAPRLDEARHDSLYEMEIALKELDRLGQNPPLWLVDRLFRNLLVDSTGNTHRAEICIDKMYSPDGPTGRLGLVEFRGFEMPPHWQMSMAQALIIRGLIAWFWEEPYRGSLKPMGTHLHDSYLLPTPLWEDFQTVLNDLSRAHGVPFDIEWYKAQLNFRFPVAGVSQVGDATLTVRNAIEPWLVLGEEGIPGGTARYVDSSVERIEVQLENFDAGRYQLLCNGVVVPVKKMADGSHIAGIRFRSWQPWKALHPTIPAHGPLRLVIYDPFSGVSVGGATYHTYHPGGRSHDFRPINALEAEGRRMARFFPGADLWPGQTPQYLGTHPDFPMTLDLRRL
ncbi:transglutaminase family protein [Donghicola sp. C2-DW-16]|uniref:Transglutaminase family protein n=1 Tax=Donghicola mangrovi TaxID=2729614 RepID=A0ABX2PI15_9RHOB|nr:transglutaminase family protein [Donghicola mangrovi]NVO28820.1 transglutaminase family protein [Donghicola mangrovi]